MKPFKFVHAADLHLDSPFNGMASRVPDEIVSTLRDATFDAYNRIVSLCLEEAVDALIIAGDVYDGADRSFKAQYRFIEGLRKLSEKEIASYICHGNHDPLDGWQSKLDFPERCYRFGKDAESFPLWEDAPGEVLIHGISYPTRVVHENLIPRFKGLEKAEFNIGVVHANVDSDPNHDPYAPCTLDDLKSTGYDYWALGHVHTKKIINETLPTVVYPGNPQGRHPNERFARGVYLVDVDSTGNVTTEFRAVDSVRWDVSEIDGSNMETEQNLVDALRSAMDSSLGESDGRSVVARAEIVGPSPIHNSLIREGFVSQVCDQLNEEYRHQEPFLWCERIIVSTSPPTDRNELKKGNDFVADLLELSDSIREDEDALASMLRLIEGTYKSGKVGKYAGQFTPDIEEIKQSLVEAENLFLPDLLEESHL